MHYTFFAGLRSPFHWYSTLRFSRPDETVAVSSLPSRPVDVLPSYLTRSSWYAHSPRYADFIQQDQAIRQYVTQFLESYRALRVLVGNVQIARTAGKVFVSFNYVAPEHFPGDTLSVEAASRSNRARSELWARWAGQPAADADLPVGWQYASRATKRHSGYFGSFLASRKRRTRTLSSLLLPVSPINSVSLGLSVSERRAWSVAAVSPVTTMSGHPTRLASVASRWFDPLPMSRRWTHVDAVDRWQSTVAGSVLSLARKLTAPVPLEFDHFRSLVKQRQRLRQLRVRAHVSRQLLTQCNILLRRDSSTKTWIRSRFPDAQALPGQFFRYWRAYVGAHYRGSKIGGPLSPLPVQWDLLHRHLEYRSGCQVFLNGSHLGAKSVRPLSLQLLYSGLSSQRRLPYAAPLLLGRRGSLQLSTPDPHLFAKLVGAHFKATRRDRPRFLTFLSRLLGQLVFHLNSSDGLLGLKIELRGKLARSPRKKKRQFLAGRMPLSSTGSQVFRGSSSIRTARGSFGVKVWLLFTSVSAYS